ncbi:bifunctional DNA-formamidopyrimidine glycosylase/DNA-(apurinic or apyrimidinic site) lyase [Patescibacteria group bacterium]|nr:bifunctional DNA-formamidopyrimidine glycosylase/DNA-(apurinic or apyrimidinic site) lyase [Patescibacteria group bacterium]
MPELPEVETVRLQLLYKVRGKIIKNVVVFHKKTVAHDPTFSQKLAGLSIANIDRIGKLLIVHFADSTHHLLAHLKMTGQFLFVDSTGISGGGHTMSTTDTTLPNKHTRVAFQFTDGSTLYFNDMRLFGYTKLATLEEVEKARAHFGPEPIAENFDIEIFAKQAKKRNAPIKAILLDQTFIAGLGNIYVDETLFRAGVRPISKGSSLSTPRLRSIARHARDVLSEAIAVGGTTFQHFTDTGGEAGNFTDYLRVFGKQRTPCQVCGTTIIKIRCAGRGTHYCPKCQKP